MKLFAVLLGGRAVGCNTELHDVVFVAGNTLKETYPQLIEKWFGSSKRLHIDSSIELTHVDGHEVVLTKEPPSSTNKKLFFVNFGGYREGFFGEVHEVNFYVASDKSEVLKRAKKEVGLSLLESHCDDNIIVDDILEINHLNDYYIHLIPSEKSEKFVIHSAYRRLDAGFSTA